MVYRKLTAIYLVLWLLFPAGLAQAAAAEAQEQGTIDAKQVAELSYLDILERADKIRLSEADLQSLKSQAESDKKRQQDELKERIKALETQQKALEKQLDGLNKQASSDTAAMKDQRREIHCNLLGLEKEIADLKMKRDTTLQVELENKLAKLDLARQWPAEEKRIAEQVQAGTARQRQYGNVDDIGVRVIQEGQEDDIKRGQEAIKELKAMGPMPPEIEDKAVQDYIDALAQKLSVNTDLRVPLHTTVLNSDEINAFALPGGFLYINSGLILKAESESELAGVMAHEIAHVVARHSARLTKKANIASVFYQGAQLAAMILTGGAVSSLLAYYAMQYGFYGLGMAISLTLLGVSRDYELEADQLGIQYLWKSDYDPKGFVTFFDKMANDKGYVRSTSFFRTHPAFAERIIHSFREISFLPHKAEYIYDSPEFHQAQDALKTAVEEGRKKKPNAPSLKKKRMDAECDPEKVKDEVLQERPRLTRPVDNPGSEPAEGSTQPLH